MLERSKLDRKKRQSGFRHFTRPLVSVLALVTLVGCKPLDDGMAAIFGRSMHWSTVCAPLSLTSWVSAQRRATSSQCCYGVGCCHTRPISRMC